MGTFRSVRGAPGLVAAALLLSACAAGTSSPTTPAASEPATAQPAPLLFTVVSTCAESSQPAPSGVTKPDPDSLWGVCEQTATDRRLSGTWEGYVRFEGDPTGDWAVSSTGTVKNDGGSWACKDFGRGFKGLAIIDGVCAGGDGYEGLTAYLHSVSDDRTATNESLGWMIESP